jgi:type I restriction enzyme, S subunit
MSEWKEEFLGNYIEVINGYAFKSTNFLDTKIDDSLPVIKIKNVANGDVHLNSVQYHAFDKNLEKFVVEKGDVLIALTGNHPQAKSQVVGETSRFKLNEKAFLNQRVAKIKPKKGLDIDYLYYFLKDNSTHDYLANQSSGSANQANISKSDIENTIVFLPLIEEQKAIAAVLTSLDDKIDLLHCQNATLEAMAETLFRQWFVEEANEDWKEYKVSDIAEHIKFNVIPSKQLTTIFHHFSLPAFDTGQNPVAELGSEILSNKYKVVADSILVSKLNPMFPRIWAIASSVRDNSICSTEFQVFRPKNKKLFAYLFFLFKSDEAKNALTMAASGTSGSHQRVRPEDISNIPFMLPTIDLAIKFSERTQPFLDKINKNQIQIRTLTTLRNTILPKLMSGEVRVK